MKLANSPVTQHMFEDIPFFLKRDDLLHSQFSGNKARKLMSLLQHDDPNITHLIGYGSPQANSLLSLAALAAIKGWQLEFYVDRIPSWLKSRPIGNYRGALDLGAKVIAMSDICAESMHPEAFIKKHRQDEHHLLVPEGGRSPIAEAGVKTLADEIVEWSRFNQDKPIVVALPSGTGTTALYLNKHLTEHGIEVLTCPCVGGEDYLIAQFNELNEANHPNVLTRNQKHHFGKLYEADYRVWQSLLEQTHIEFDLLYDPLMWRCLLEWYPQNTDKQLLYIHQGGVLGNESMLPRYQRKFD
ncbi:pyridoxal-phosphate dependent enzyme [Enterovibrio calviensis]|uniref:pyridoxal-phosphate dependent enzyme n=1 Tax=Enterovibrio calviensis TaxID=91359 RepID=UPI000481794B|nr:pyridoxal-phosphate dependent enzyme [Enterovibrio calviensis]